MAERNPAAQELQAFVRRVEAIEDRIRVENEDKSELYKEMRGQGYDVKIVRKIVAARAKDSSKREEEEALYGLYWDAIHGVVRAHVENIEQFPVEHDADGAFPDDEVTHETTNGGLNESAAHPEPVNHPGRRQSAPAPEVEQNGSEHQRSDLNETNEAPAGRVADESPATSVTRFIPKPLRPNCQRPERCGGQGREHCYSCRVAAEQAGAA